MVGSDHEVILEIRFAAAYAENHEMKIIVSKLKIPAVKIILSCDHQDYILLLHNQYVQNC